MQPAACNENHRLKYLGYVLEYKNAFNGLCAEFAIWNLDQVLQSYVCKNNVALIAYEWTLGWKLFSRNLRVASWVW